MLRWPNNQGVMGDDPPYLVVGTEVSAKYKGAFCEAKVRKVVRSVKCKVNFKVGGSAILTDDQIRGTLRASAVVEAKHPEKKEFVEACITKIQDCSQYTVVFDDGDITTLRRTALCLKSGRHFAESETLDQLPLTHPEHFGNPVVGNRRGGRRSRNPMSDESSDEEDEPPRGKLKEEREADIGKVICVELGDKKKQKDNWFPGLVVHPAAQEVVRIRVKDEYLVRSFKDGRYFTVPKKEASEFTREVGLKVDNNTLKTAVDKALQYLDKDELPPHWDRELLFGLEDASTASDSDAAFDSDTSDDEPREEKDHFVAQLYKFMDDRGTPINRGPVISGRDIDLYKLFKVVHKLGGCNRVTNHSQWKIVSHKVGFGQFSNTANLVKVAYKKYLHSFEEFYRKLGCTMVNHPRGNRVRHRGGRSLIRDKDRATPVNVPRSDAKQDKNSDADEDYDESIEKAEDCPDLSAEEKDDELTKPREIKEAEIVSGPLVLGPSSLERKLVDPQLKVSTPRGKPKRLADAPASKSSVDSKKKNIATKPKVVQVVGDDAEGEAESLDIEDLEDEDDDKLTTTRSKAKEELSKPKIEVKSIPEGDKKMRMVEGSEKRNKPSFTATAEKKMGRPSSAALSDKKSKVTPDSDRKTVRSLAAEFEKKAKSTETDRKEITSADCDKRARTYSASDNEKKIRPSLTATLERKKTSGADSDKKSRLAVADPEKKIRPSLTADPERKKVRPSLTADPTKKVSRIENDKRKDKAVRSSDTDDSERKIKVHDVDRKNTSSESGKSSVGDLERKSLKSESGESDKRGNSKSKKAEEEKRKQHVRKRKENDEAGSSSVDDSLDLLPSYKNVCIGDKLKVYYGPTHESKVTYEAKVLEVEGEAQSETYLVHYTGWNNRYDEWIKRSRIADNLSWTPARGKRRHQTPLLAVKKSSVKKRNTTPARDGASPLQRDLSVVDKSREHQPPRSSTPSSVTSSSSRTKSPAMRLGSARVTRNTLGDASHQPIEQYVRRTRTRRTSGQTDLPTESESDGSGSESEAETSTTRKSTRRLVSDRDDDSAKKESASKKKLRRREVEVEAEDDEDKEGDKDDSKDEDDVSSESPSEEKLSMKRGRKGTKGTIEQKVDIKIEQEEERVHPSSSVGKGIGLDLNQIRSELKGIDKTVKTSSFPSKEIESDVGSEPNIDMDTTSLLESKASTLLEPEECALDMEDIYEFKEPEPFEFEVRAKREPSVEPTSKLQKRPLPRIFDDVEPIIKKKVSSSNVVDSESSADEEGSPAKKKFRQAISKKDDTDVKIDSISSLSGTNIEKLVVFEPATPQKKLLSPASDEAFEKLRQSPSFRLSSGSPVRSPTPTFTGLQVVSSTVQSPPVLNSASSSNSTTNSMLGHGRSYGPSVISTIHTHSLKAVPNQPALKPLSIAPESKASAISSSQEGKPSGGVKHISTSSVTAPPAPPCPPVLAAATKVPSEKSIVSQVEDKQTAKQQASDIVESRKDEQIHVKIEKDDSLPPLVPTSLSFPSSDRSSPEPPQLLPILGLAPKLFQESSKPDAKEVQMPLIKIESSVNVEPVISKIKPSPAPFKPEIKVIEDDLPEGISSRISCRRKAQFKRKKAVSKEFVEDSDSDSSEEGSRLVIESESSDSASEPDEVKASIPVDKNDFKWRTSGKLKLHEQDDKIQDSDKSRVTKKDDPLTKSKDVSSPNASEDEVSEDPSSVLKIDEETEKLEEPEVDTNLCSLYCEETIPGSPAPPCDMPSDVNTEPSSLRASDRPLENVKASCKVLEMPFASVPGNTRSSGPSSSNPATTTAAKVSRNEKTDVVAGSAKTGSSASSVEAAPVIDNTPPTTPDSSISTLSNSPHGEHGDALSIMDNDSIKSHRDSEDADHKDIDFSDDDLDVGTRMQRLSALTEKKEIEREKTRCETDAVSASPNKKRRRSSKVSENEDRSKRPRHSSTRAISQEAASDSDDNSEVPTPNITPQIQPPTSNQASASQLTSPSVPCSNSQSQVSRSPRPSKYNFFVELAPELDASQRISLLMHKLQELRKTYAQVKQELACIDRRRKKLRRREREARLEARKMMREERRQTREEVVNCS